MAGRRLDPEERKLWQRIAATVTPLGGRNTPAPSEEDRVPEIRPAVPPAIVPPPRAGGAKKAQLPADTLDGGWDRRLRRGSVSPDRAIDLHGHTLATAHAALDFALGQAIADDVRVLLVVTGKPPRPDDRRRGLIRGAIGDWLAHSPYAGSIAAVRNAHPRHGGAGALYLILRRRRGG